MHAFQDFLLLVLGSRDPLALTRSLRGRGCVTKEALLAPPGPVAGDEVSLISSLLSPLELLSPPPLAPLSISRMPSCTALPIWAFWLGRGPLTRMLPLRPAGSDDSMQDILWLDVRPASRGKPSSSKLTDGIDVDRAGVLLLWHVCEAEARRLLLVEECRMHLDLAGVVNVPEGAVRAAGRIGLYQAHGCSTPRFAARDDMHSCLLPGSD